LSFLPLNHIFEKVASYIYLYSGMSIYYAESMETIGENLKEVAPDGFSTVPRLLEKVFEKIMMKGEELTGLKRKLFFWAVALGEQYDNLNPGSAWYQFQLKLANKIIFSKWREGLGGNVKFIVTGGAACQVKSETVIDGWLHTGDIGELIDGKYLKITDRKKELFKTSGGKYVAPQPIENKMKESPFIEQIVLVGDNKKMVTALVVPSFAKLREWAKQNDTEFTSNEAIIQHPKVLSMFESIIAEYNLLYNQVEQVKKFTLIPREFTIDQGEMTPKLSIRRKQVLANFEKEIDLMYQG